MRIHLYSSFYLILFLFIFACGKSEEKTTQKKQQNVSEGSQKNDPYQNFGIEGFEKDKESGQFISTDESSNVAYVSIQTQRCENCDRLKNLNNFKEEVSLANEFKNAYAKEMNGKTVFFAEMKSKSNSRADEELGPVITAEFMSDKTLMVTISIVPKEIPENKKIDFSNELNSFLNILTKI